MNQLLYSTLNGINAAVNLNFITIARSEQYAPTFMWLFVVFEHIVTFANVFYLQTKRKYLEVV